MTVCLSDGVAVSILSTCRTGFRTIQNLCAVALLAGAGLAWHPPAMADAFGPSGAGKPVTVGEMAAPYRAVQRDIEKFSTLSYRNLREVRQTHTLISGYDPHQVAQGWFAHHAILAANQPDFFNSVRKASRAEGETAFLRRIMTDAAQLHDLPGAKTALRAVMESINSQTSRMAAMAELFRTRAQELQDQRLAAGEAADEEKMSADTAHDLLHAHDLEDRLSLASLSEPARAMLNRILVLATHIVLGAASGPDFNTVLALASERSMDRCVNWSKLNLDQCIAATRFPEEEAFCLGRYGVEELGDCWRWMISR